MGARWFLALITALAAPLGFPSAAQACSCVGGIPICESFWKTPVVFAGEVLSITPAQTPAPHPWMGRVAVRFRVEQTWRGEVPPEIDVLTGSGGGDCGYAFERGLRYIVYAQVSGGRLSTGICSRTRPLSKAAEDLAYFKTAFRPSAVGRIVGSAHYQRQGDGSAQPVAGYDVTLQSASRKWQTKTAADGSYEFKDVPAGKYNVRLHVPETEHAYGMTTVELADPRGCAATFFIVAPNGHVTLRVVDADGKAVPEVTVEVGVLSTFDGQRLPDVRFARSGADGLVVFRELPPDRYVVGINLTRPPAPQQQYARLFLPAAADVKEAAVFDLGRGERLELPPLVLPAPLYRHEITGVVSWPDGSPAAGVSVNLWAKDPLRQAGEGTRTDATGRFVLGAFAGQRYEVSAYINDVAVEGRREQWRARSNPFDATADVQPLKLVLQPPTRR